MDKSYHHKSYRKFISLEDDIETAKLKLALLKENFEYRAFFDELKIEVDELKNNLEKENLNSFKFPSGKPAKPEKSDLDEKLFSFACNYVCHIFELNPSGLLSLNRNRILSFSDLMFLFDPKNEDFSALDPEVLNKILSKLFYERGVIAIRPVKENSPISFDYPVYKLAKNFESLDLEPHERLLKIDLRKQKSDLMNEISVLLDIFWKDQEVFRESKKDDLKDFENWKADRMRKRKETWTHLRVWKLKKKRMRFPEIAKELGLTEDNARKSYYRAYELTQGKKYDKDTAKKKFRSVKKSELIKICNTCDQRKNCETLCPEVLRYIDQDTLKRLKEKLLPDIEYPSKKS
jgi:hypothetical protein